MNERSKYIAFFLGDTDDYGIVLLGLFIVTMAIPEHPIALISIATYSVLYLLRYRLKSDVRPWDKFKLGITLLVLIVHFDNHLIGLFGSILFNAIKTTWLFTYYIDRVLIRVSPESSWKASTLTVLIAVFFIVFAQIHAKEHAMQKIMAKSMAKNTTKLQKLAEQEAANALEAEHRVKALEIELKNCQQSK